MLWSHRLGAIIEVRHLMTKLNDGCVWTVSWPAVLLKLKLVPCLWLYKVCGIQIGNLLKYTCAKNCRNSWSSSYCKNKTVQFFLPHMRWKVWYDSENHQRTGSMTLISTQFMSDLYKNVLRSWEKVATDNAIETGTWQTVKQLCW